MDFKEILEDLTTLEVATLTNHIATSLEIHTEPAEPAANSDLGIAIKGVEDMRKALLAQLKKNPTVRSDIREAKRNLRIAEKQLEETQKALGIYDPKDLFSKIRAALPTANLVAYSRFELEGDSTNFINSHPDVQGLVGLHHHMVAASQEARKALFDAALKSDRRGPQA